MRREEFLKVCAASCLAYVGVNLAACKPAKQVQATVSGNRHQVKKDDFKVVKGGKVTYRSKVIYRPATERVPVVIYRFSDSEFSALLLECTHQKNELNVNGDILTCPAHGSEFGNRGEVLQGPAENGLRRFKVTADAESIYLEIV